MFQQMYEEMLAKMRNQLDMTEFILADFIKQYKKADNETNQEEIVRCQRNIDYEQGYKAGVQICLTILESDYDKIA